MERRDDTILVGSRYPDGDLGPVAQVTWDDTWLHINTDDYEGHAMLKIEALPYLLRALSLIKKQTAKSEEQ